mmetsp:Transcript_38037/g.67074  ORF Transcript_38037/g.67074 Transcript_38037/m.67074 type:complete len:153 (+) Transcript_38037:29-487(+)
MRRPCREPQSSTFPSAQCSLSLLSIVCFRMSLFSIYLPDVFATQEQAACADVNHLKNVFASDVRADDSSRNSHHCHAAIPHLDCRSEAHGREGREESIRLLRLFILPRPDWVSNHSWWRKGGSDADQKEMDVCDQDDGTLICDASAEASLCQ